MYNQPFTLVFESNEDRIKLINLLHEANPSHLPGFSLEIAGIGVSIELAEPIEPIAAAEEIKEAE